MVFASDEIMRIDENKKIGYNAVSASKNGGANVKLTASEIIRKAIAVNGFSLASFGRILGCTGQNVSLKLSRNSVSADEFISWLDMLGFDVAVFSRNNLVNIEDCSDMKGPVRHIVRMIDGKHFNNKTAQAVSNNFMPGDSIYDEFGKATELYKIEDGTYIFVEYNEDPKKDVVSIAPRSAAEAFIASYGKLNMV